MSNIRLLERLSALEAPPSANPLPQDRQLRESVAAHLQRLLNSRRGSVPIDAQYGMSDMSNIAGSFAVGTIESLVDEIVEQVRRYEPRLRNPHIVVEKEQRDVIALRFELQGRLASDHAESAGTPLTLSLRVSASGRVHVEPLR